MWKETTLVSALVCLGFVSSPKDSKKPDQEKVPTEFRVPPEDASRKNPLTTSPNAIAEGKRRYGFECAACHGKEGDGKGDLVEEMKLKLRDWRDPAALKDFTDGELFYIINKGKGVMTGGRPPLQTPPSLPIPISHTLIWSSFPPPQWSSFTPPLTRSPATAQPPERGGAA
jgi:cytochrome c553